MITKFFVVICLSLCMNYSFGKLFNDDYIDQSNDYKQQEILIQFEDKMKTLFSVWKTETNRKLDTIEQMIPVLEQSINRKLHSLRNSVVDKLEEYIDSKINNLLTNITEKLKHNVNCKLDVLDKNTFETFEKNINFKFDVLARNISNCKSDALIKVTNLGNNVNQKIDDLDKKIPTNFYENINIKLNNLAKNISEELEGHNNCQHCISSYTNVTDFTADRPAHSNITLPDKECNVTHTTETPAIVETTTPREDIKLPCKEVSLNKNFRSPDYSVYNETLNHAAVQRDSAGRLTHFELHFALQADSYLVIWLKNKYYAEICQIYVGVENNQYTDLYALLAYNPNWTKVQHTHTPEIFSSTQFRSFYIKVDDGTMQFGKEGDSTPVVSHYDDRYRSLEYFQVHFSGDYTVFRYDCPHVPGLPCKEVSLSSRRVTPHYSVYNESLQHVTVQRDSAGRLTHFELHVALQADEGMNIRLRNDLYLDICLIDVGVESNQYTELYANKPYWSRVQRTHTPDILSSTQFRSFYIKVVNGTLQFGKEGDSTPLVSHYYARYRSAEYFQFGYYGNNTSKIRYDCPHVPESS